MQFILKNKSNTLVPTRMRPMINADSNLVSKYVEWSWNDIETNLGVDLEFHPDARTMMHIGREELPLFGAFDETRTYATTMFGYVALRDGKPLATHAIALYSLGSYDLAEYLKNFGMFDGCPTIKADHRRRRLRSAPAAPPNSI